MTRKSSTELIRATAQLTAQLTVLETLNTVADSMQATGQTSITPDDLRLMALEMSLKDRP